jgi:hypothetical protein
MVTDPQCTNNGGTITFTGGDTNGNDVLDPGETWTLSCTASFTGAGTFTNTAKGHGIDPVGKDVTACADPNNPPADVRCDQDETDSTSVTVSINQGKPLP